MPLRAPHAATASLCGNGSPGALCVLGTSCRLWCYFARKTVLDGDALAQLHALQWEQFYPVGQKERLRDYSVLREAQLADGAGSGAFIADLDQNAGHGPQAGSMRPTLVTHGILHSWVKQRCLVPEEHLAVQGVQIYHTLQHNPEMRSLLQPLISSRSLSRGEMKKLAGNGMHQLTIASVVFFTLATMRRASQGIPAQLEARQSRTCSSDEDDTLRYDIDDATQQPVMQASTQTVLHRPRRLASIVEDGSQQDSQL